MTLIIATDVQDHLILAGDHCAVLSRVSNDGPPETVLDSYRKVYPWKYGAISGSGDVFLMAYFCRLLQRHERKGGPIDLLQVAKEAKATRSQSGIHPRQSVGNFFFALPRSGGFDLFRLSIGEDTIDYEIVEPFSTHFSMRGAPPDNSFCNEFNSRLRPSFFFESTNDFHRHHIDLLQAFFLHQSSFDKFVTASFDVYIQDKRTGAGLLWQVSDTAKTLCFVRFEEDADDGCTMRGLGLPCREDQSPTCV